MADDLKDAGEFDLTNDLQRALADLEGALTEAARAAGAIRGKVSQIATLADIVHEMGAAIALARRLGVREAGAQLERQEAQPASARHDDEAHSYPPPAPEPSAPAAEPDAEPELLQPPARRAPEPDDLRPERTPDEQPSHRMRLAVVSKTGPLDLKAVDSSVNENPAVVDVALLDFDGRRATLKLWVTGSADPTGVRLSLIESLRRRLGEEREADVRIDLEERSAA